MSVLDLKRNPNNPQIERFSKVDQLIDMLPFQCKLNLRFQASANGFLTKNLYSLKIQGPVIVLISSKNKVFGGYSPNMWTER